MAFFLSFSRPLLSDEKLVTMNQALHSKWTTIGIGLSQRHRILMMENTAHTVDTYYSDYCLGGEGHAIFSFHATNNMICAEGCMVVTDKEALIERIRDAQTSWFGCGHV